MTCSNPSCPKPKKEHLFLFAGKLCAACKHLYVEPLPSRMPAGRKEVAKDMEVTAGCVGKHRDRQYAPKTRIRYVIELDGLYRQRLTDSRQRKWGDLITAKVYKSLPMAQQAVRLIGENKAKAVRI